jgi:hypothetical protein
MSENNHSGSGTDGADHARAYVPPQVVPAKAQPSFEAAQKVRVSAAHARGNDPRRAGSERGVAQALLGSPPVTGQPVSGTIPQYETNPPPPPAPVTAPPQDALPFRSVMPQQPQPQPQPAPPMAMPATNGVAAGGGFTPKHPPLQLTSPGQLIGAPLGAPAGDVMPFTAPAATQIAPMAAPPAGAMSVPVTPAPVTPQPVAPPAFAAPPPMVMAAAPAITPPPVITAPPPVITAPPPVMTAPPPVAAPAAPAVAPPPMMGPAPVPLAGGMNAPVVPAAEPVAPASDPPASPPPGTREDDHPLATTNSPWSAEKKVDADVLPSAMVAIPAVPVKPSAAPAPVAEEPRSRSGMTILMAVAALGLIGALVYFFVIDRKSNPNDPAKVNVGTEQRDYDMGEGPAPVASASATEAPPPPKPPPPKILPKPVVKPPPTQPPDIYEP